MKYMPGLNCFISTISGNPTAKVFEIVTGVLCLRRKVILLKRR